jgi:hypothetical protein
MLGQGRARGLFLPQTSTNQVRATPGCPPASRKGEQVNVQVLVGEALLSPTHQLAQRAVELRGQRSGAAVQGPGREV